VRTSFTVKSVSKDEEIGSTTDLAKTKKEKHKGSLTSLKVAANLGGSLMSLGTKVLNHAIKRIFRLINFFPTANCRKRKESQSSQSQSVTKWRRLGTRRREPCPRQT
jgi:hypothetical protein